ncbi:hypothetical protein KSS87_021011 [Heliosperma pusillum]|nr:hypothetical protein KSS87_021011 [Heliosperma pusillum]
MAWSYVQSLKSVELIGFGEQSTFGFTVKLFLSEDCPSQIGSKAEDHLQIKASLHSNGMNVDDLPPGFGGKGHSYTPNPTNIFKITWSRPAMFALNPEWHVVAGEESDEKGTQNFREMRVLEALYPRVSAIPPSPSLSPELEVCYYDDSQTPIIPLNSTEDEDIVPIESTPCSNTANGVEHNAPIESTSSANEKLHGIVAGLDADVIAAAAAALKNNDSLVDTDLLIRILKEPKMIEALTRGSSGSSLTPISEHHLPVSLNMQNICQPKLSSVSPTTSGPTYSTPYSDTPSISVPLLPNLLNSSASLDFRSGHENGHYMSRDDRGKPMGHESELPRKVVPPSADPFIRPDRLSVQSSLKPEDMYAGHRPPSMGPLARPDNHNLAMGPPPMVMGSSQFPIRTPATKDLNYYKSLIRLHGSGADETTQVSPPEPAPVQGHVRPKPQKPCKFFNSPKGCRYGSTCPFDHVLDLRPASGNYPDGDRSKRLKISNDSSQD